MEEAKAPLDFGGCGLGGTIRYTTAAIRHTPPEVRRMTEELKQLGEDHEVWLKCFVATLSGATMALGTENRVGPEHSVSMCAAIADAALVEERKRRPEVKWPR